MAGKFLRFTGELNGIRVDPKWTKELDEKLQRLVKQAAKEWLRAVIKSVPVWTGFASGAIRFAKGTDGDLAVYLRVLGNLPTLIPKSDRPKYYYPPGRGKVPKTPEEGGNFAQYSFPSSQHRYRFSFRSDVIYFIINDFYGSKITGEPWMATEAGHRAFKKYIRENISSLVKVTNAFVKPFDESVRFG